MYDTVEYFAIGDPGGFCEGWDSVTVNFLYGPSPGLSISQDTIMTVTNGPYSTMQWYEDSVLIVGATAATYTATTDGEYFCRVSDANGCYANTGPWTVGVFNSLSEQETYNVSVYPNPASDVLYINTIEPAELTVVNAQGKICLQQALTTGNNTILVRTLHKGVYHLKIIGDRTVAVRKLLKE